MDSLSGLSFAVMVELQLKSQRKTQFLNYTGREFTTKARWNSIQRSRANIFFDSWKLEGSSKRNTRESLMSSGETHLYHHPVCLLIEQRGRIF
jgi:hypothetical protein